MKTLLISALLIFGSLARAQEPIVIFPPPPPPSVPDTTCQGPGPKGTGCLAKKAGPPPHNTKTFTTEKN